MTQAQARMTTADFQATQSSVRLSRARKHTPLHHYLELAHKGHIGGKVHHHSHRLYRHGNSHHPRGVHDFQNIQWDPSIYRGRTFKDFREKMLPPFSTVVNANKYCCSNVKHLLQPTKEDPFPLPPSKFKRSTPTFKVGGIVRPTSADIMNDDMERMKLEDKKQNHGWEAFLIEQITTAEYRDSTTQPDHLKNSLSLSTVITRTGAHRCVSVAVGPSKSSQANIPYTGTAEKEDPIHPLVTAVGCKVLEQSLLETTEEYELRRIREEINKFMNKRLARDARAAKLAENKLAKAEQKALEKRRTEREMKAEFEAGEFCAAAMFASQLGKRIWDDTFEILQKMDFMQSMGKDLASSFLPWCDQEVLRFIEVPRMVLNDIIEMAQVAIETDAALRIDIMTPPNTANEITQRSSWSESIAAPRPRENSNAPPPPRPSNTGEAEGNEVPRKSEAQSESSIAPSRKSKAKSERSLKSGKSHAKSESTVPSRKSRAKSEKSLKSRKSKASKSKVSEEDSGQEQDSDKNVKFAAVK